VDVIRPMRNFHFYHVALVTPIANALYKCGGSNYTLAADRGVVREMILSVRECMRALRKKGLKARPASLALLICIPLWLIVPKVCKIMGTPHIETVAARHAQNAREEMGFLYRELMDFIGDSGEKLTYTRELAEYI